MFPAVDSGDAAQLAAVVGAIGAAFVLLGRGRLLILPGLALLAIGELGLVHDLSGNRVSTKLAALGVASLLPMAIGAAILVRWPYFVTPLIARRGPVPASALLRQRAPLLRRRRQLGTARPPASALRRARRGGARARVAVAARMRTRRVTLLVSVPAIVFLGISAISLLWTDDLHAGEDVLAYFLLPSAARRPRRTRAVSALAPAGAAVIAVARRRSSRSSG